MWFLTHVVLYIIQIASSYDRYNNCHKLHSPVIQTNWCTRRTKTCLSGLSSLPCCEFLVVMSELSWQTMSKSKWNAMFYCYIYLPNIIGGCLLWSPLALFQSLSLLEHLSVHTLAQFGWQGVNRVLEGRGAHWGATAGSRCLSGLLVLHKDYCRQEARGQDNRLRSDNLFTLYRENIIRGEVSSFMTHRHSHVERWDLAICPPSLLKTEYIVQCVANSSRAWMSSE